MSAKPVPTPWDMSNQEKQMPSQETKWYKDVRLVQMLDEMRQKNLAFMAQCYFCDQKSEGIKSIGYQLFPVCPNHESPNPD